MGGCEAGNLSVNCAKNRYKDVVPLEVSRVKLFGSITDGSDYINANFVDDESGERAYIATQAPVADTLHDFWRMVWEHKVGIVVMLTSPNDCEVAEYWPPNPRESAQAGSVRVSWEAGEANEHFLTRSFLLERDGVKRSVHHIQFLEWADNGTPEMDGFQALIEEVEEQRRLRTEAWSKEPQPPIVVHCKAGIGRTGVFCTLDSIVRDLNRAWALQSASNSVTIPSVSVLSVAKRVRSQRLGSIQTEEQYTFIYHFLHQWLAKLEGQKMDRIVMGRSAAF